MTDTVDKFGSNEGGEFGIAPSGPRKSFPIELLPKTSKISDGRVSIGGVDLGWLANEVGTPFFVYDEEHIRTVMRRLKRSFVGEVAYASKAFLCRELARIVDEEGLFLDVATQGEIFVALSAGFPASRMIFHGNNKSSEELRFALEAGVGRVVVDSFDELDRLDTLASGPVRVWIRVTPGVEAHTHEYVMTGQEDSKFGFSFNSGAAERAIKRVLDSSNLVLVGLHCHIGSQILRLESYRAAIEVMAVLVRRYELAELNIGGGLGVPYVGGEEAPSLEEWVSELGRYAEQAGIPSAVRLHIEPGRSIIAQAAVTVYRAGTIKRLEGIRTYVSVDGGMSDNPRPVLYGSGYDTLLVERAEDVATEIFCISGKHCESGDILVREALLPADLAVGELIGTPVTGAYGYSMASNYNKVLRPPVVFVKDGKHRVVVRRESLDDLLRLE